MKRENALTIATLLELELKDETEHYNPNHTLWVKDVISAMEEFYKENDFSMIDADKLIQDYCETKEWHDNGE